MSTTAKQTDVQTDQSITETKRGREGERASSIRLLLEEGGVTECLVNLYDGMAAIHWFTEIRISAQEGTSSALLISENAWHADMVKCR